MSFKPLPIKPTIQFPDFDKIDIRVGKIEEVQDIEKSNKLVRLIVDFGDFKRTILAGIKKEREDIKELEGKQSLFVVNLEPKEIMGEMSEGMLFAIGYENEIKAVLAQPEENVPEGSRAS